jgi:hypothetical protein
MAYASIIGALVDTGFDIYGQLSKPNPQTALDQESSRINNAANTYLAPFTQSNAWNINPQQLEQQSIQFGLQNAPAINQANMTQLQSMLNQAFPGYQTLFNQAATNTGQLLQGQVPSDVQNQIQRFAAQQALGSGGYGAGPIAPGAGLGGVAGGTAGTIAARNLGLTSLGLQQQGTSQFQGLMQTASNYMMPQLVNPLSLLPLSTLINTQEWSDTSLFNANQAMFTAKSNAAAAAAGMPSQSIYPGLGAGIASGISALGQSPSGQSGGSGSIMSMIMGMFGGSGGSGGGAAGGNLAATSNYGNMAVNSTAGEF